MPHQKIGLIEFQILQSLRCKTELIKRSIRRCQHGRTLVRQPAPASVNVSESVRKRTNAIFVFDGDSPNATNVALIPCGCGGARSLWHDASSA
jgi:hypothetical protein